MITRIVHHTSLVLVLSATLGAGAAHAFSFCFGFGSHHRDRGYPGAYLPPPLFPPSPWQPGWAAMPGIYTDLQPPAEPQPQQQPAAGQQPKAPVITFPERY